jgi:hypothetical protein
MPGPYNFESQPKFARNLVLSPYIQPAWNTALADAKMTYRQRFDGAAVLERTITRRSDIDYAGKGTAFATNGQITAYDTKFTGLKHEATAWLAGYYLSLLMGQETVVGTTDGEDTVAPYTHTFTFDESTRTAQKTTVYVEDTEDMHYMVPDMAVDEVTITINDIGAIMIESSLIGTGYWTEHTLDSVPDAPAETYLLNSDAALTFGPVGETASFIGRHMNTTLKLQNQCVLHRAPGGGLYGIFVRKGNPKFSLSTTFAAKDTDDIYTLFQNDTACDYELAVNSGDDSQLTVSIPAMHLKTAKLGLDGDMVVWQVENDETTNYQAAGTPPITVAVVNSLAAYLTAGS